MQFFTHQQINRITQVDADTIQYIADGGWKETYEPIPLTDDILTANGFVHMYDIVTVWEREEYYNGNCVPHIHLYIRDSNQYPLELDWNGNCVFIHYVHELQHVLRLCGLNDLANNLKVE